MCGLDPRVRTAGWSSACCPFALHEQLDAQLLHAERDDPAGATVITPTSSPTRIAALIAKPSRTWKRSVCDTQVVDDDRAIGQHAIDVEDDQRDGLEFGVAHGK